MDETEIARELLHNLSAMFGRDLNTLTSQQYVLAALRKSKAGQERKGSFGKPGGELATAHVLQNPLVELFVIGERLRTQDNRITSNPMFCVQERKRDYGYDPQFTDNCAWLDPEEYFEVEAGTPGAIKSGYKDRWDTVMVAFTESGCVEYLALNGHNHRGITRIYVESWNRCPEMIAIRSALLEALSVPKHGGSHATGASCPKCQGRGWYQMGGNDYRKTCECRWSPQVEQVSVVQESIRDETPPTDVNAVNPRGQIKCFTVIPSPVSRYDSYTRLADHTWGHAAELLEESLERQFNDGKEWHEIQATVKCAFFTKEQLEGMNDE